MLQQVLTWLRLACPWMKYESTEKVCFWCNFHTTACSNIDVAMFIHFLSTGCWLFYCSMLCISTIDNPAQWRHGAPNAPAMRRHLTAKATLQIFGQRVVTLGSQHGLKHMKPSERRGATNWRTDRHIKQRNYNYETKPQDHLPSRQQVSPCFQLWKKGCIGKGTPQRTTSHELFHSGKEDAALSCCRNFSISNMQIQSTTMKREKQDQDLDLSKDKSLWISYPQSLH